MNNKLYVGQLSFGVSSEELGEAFSSAGQVTSAKVITDKETGRSKGFGFVEMATDAEALTAIEQFNGKEIKGRPVTVAIAKPMENRPRGGGGGGRGFGGGNRGGGRGFGGNRN